MLVEIQTMFMDSTPLAHHISNTARLIQIRSLKRQPPTSLQPNGGFAKHEPHQWQHNLSGNGKTVPPATRPFPLLPQFGYYSVA